MAIPTYNNRDCLLREALGSVLRQDPGADQMQIDVIDDCSGIGDPERVVRELGRGRVQFYRQKVNVGTVANFETCLQRATGKVVHILHGDDLVREGFYVRMQQPFVENRNIGMAFCRHACIDSSGEPIGVGAEWLGGSGLVPDFLEKMAAHNLVQTPAVVVRREIYESLGGFDRRLSYCEDWEMWIRIGARYAIWHEADVLADYRLHGESSSARQIGAGSLLPDLSRAIQIMSTENPLSAPRSLMLRAKRWHARHGLILARDLARLGKWKEAKAMALQAWQLQPSGAIASQVLYHSLQLALENIFSSPQHRRSKVDRRLRP